MLLGQTVVSDAASPAEWALAATGVITALAAIAAAWIAWRSVRVAGPVLRVSGSWKTLARGSTKEKVLAFQVSNEGLVEANVRLLALRSYRRRRWSRSMVEGIVKPLRYAGSYTLPAVVDRHDAKQFLISQEAVDEHAGEAKWLEPVLVTTTDRIIVGERLKRQGTPTESAEG